MEFMTPINQRRCAISGRKERQDAFLPVYYIHINGNLAWINEK